jgi:hypothetical protein
MGDGGNHVATFVLRLAPLEAGFCGKVRVPVPFLPSFFPDFFISGSDRR